MCKVGDIILIKEFKNDRDVDINKHSFLVIEDESGHIRGMAYDFVCNMLCSIKGFRQERSKLSNLGNVHVASKDMVTNPHNGKDAYLNMSDIYYFNKELIDYRVIGHLTEDALDEIFDFMDNDDIKFNIITSNL